eukprot:10413755-Karenia_brevis.AAC.1
MPGFHLQDLDYGKELSPLIGLNFSWQRYTEVSPVAVRPVSTTSSSSDASVLIVPAGTIRVNYHSAVIE